MNPISPGYKAYILRVWQREQETGPLVVASLEDPHTCRQIVFAGLPELLRFLERTIQEETQNDEKNKDG
jgi:hypothetical protein